MLNHREYTPHPIYRPENLFKTRQIDPAGLTAEQALEAIHALAAETMPSACVDYFMQRLKAIEILAERALAEKAYKSHADQLTKPPH